MIEVLHSGLLTTVQDLGRPYHAHQGVSVGGAADTEALEIGNYLVGNSPRDAALEMTLRGGRFRFLTDVTFALTGSDFAPSLDESPVMNGRTLHARPGQVLSLEASRGGARSYLCVRGGIDVPLVLGSRATLLGAGLGGFFGRALRAGDTLAIGRPKSTAQQDWVFVDEVETRDITEIRITGGVTDSLVSTEFTVTEQSNRSGLRLAGQKILSEIWQERISEGVLWGMIQLPASGQPIILMNDQCTTGGYPVIGQVILRDLPRLGQLKPRDRVRFRRVEIDEAITLLHERRNQWKQKITQCSI